MTVEIQLELLYQIARQSNDYDKFNAYINNRYFNNLLSAVPPNIVVQLKQEENK